MTTSESEDLIKEKEGKLCGRIFRRADGTVLTQDCPVGLEKIRARALVAKQAIATFLVGVMGFVLGLALPQKWKQPLEDALAQKMIEPVQPIYTGRAIAGEICITPPTPPSNTGSR